MTDKVFGLDFTNSTTPAPNWTISINNGTDLIDVALVDLQTSFGIGYNISASVASNNLTITLTDFVNASAPSATNPLFFRIGTTFYKMTASPSFTKNAGTNWCNAGGAELAGNPTDFFVYVIGESGAAAGVKLGFSR